jgi:putative membrane protein
MGGGGRLLGFWPLTAGVGLLAALWLGPLPAMARVSFSVHMILHLAVMLAAAPLLALGAVRARAVPGRAPWIAIAAGAAVVEMMVVWGWHAPTMHEAAALSPRIFALQQASFLGAGMLVWLPGLAAPGRGGAAAGTLAMLLSFTHMSMLGVLLTLAPALVYAPELCLGAFGLAPLEDQRLGGALMAVAGGLPYLAGGTVFAYRLLARRVPRSRSDGAAWRA